MLRLNCNSSMPRAGSELMQALLAQHPEVYASATSPLLEYWYGALGNITLPEVKSQSATLMREAFIRFCREGTNGYYSALTPKQVIVDKSRGWLEYADLLWDVFPDARIICMVRPIPEIIASLERIYRQHPGHPETRELPKTAQERANYWTTPGRPPLGLALSRLNDRGHDDRIMRVGYNTLVDDPIQTMRQVFTFLRLDPIDIDPNNVQKAVPEDDSHYGIFGSHQLRSTVSRRK
jgi:sulfotransferase